MFCFGTEIGTENRGFSLVSVPNTEIGTENRGFSLVSVPNTEIGTENRGFSLVSVPNTEIGTENRGFSLVSVPNTEIGTENRGFSLVSVPNTEIGTENRGFSLVSVPNTEIGTENRGFSLVSVPNTDILVPWQHYFDQLISVNFPVIHNYWISAFLFLYIRTHIPQFLASQIFKKHSVTQNTHQRWPKLLEHLTDLKILTFFANKTWFIFIMFIKHADGCSEHKKYQMKWVVLGFFYPLCQKYVRHYDNYCNTPL